MPLWNVTAWSPCDGFVAGQLIGRGMNTITVDVPDIDEVVGELSDMGARNVVATAVRADFDDRPTPGIEGLLLPRSGEDGEENP